MAVAIAEGKSVQIVKKGGHHYMCCELLVTGHGLRLLPRCDTCEWQGAPCRPNQHLAAANALQRHVEEPDRP